MGARTMPARDGVAPAGPLDQPCRGDIVVTHDRSASPHFTLHQVPGDPQVSWASQQGAIDVARAFARRHGVDLWLSDGGDSTRLVRHRSTTSLRVAGTPMKDWRTS